MSPSPFAGLVQMSSSSPVKPEPAEPRPESTGSKRSLHTPDFSLEQDRSGKVPRLDVSLETWQEDRHELKQEGRQEPRFEARQEVREEFWPEGRQEERQRAHSTWQEEISTGFDRLVALTSGFDRLVALASEVDRRKQKLERETNENLHFR